MCKLQVARICNPEYKAIAAAQAAVSIDPSLEQYMLEFIENINK